jgi:glycine cleavage system pyridoxal-binding protein P
MITSLVLGLARQDSVSDENRFAELRMRLEQVPNVRRISLVGSRDPVPAALRYLLRCRWPQAQIIMDENWDAGLTEAMEAEAYGVLLQYPDTFGHIGDYKALADAVHARGGLASGKVRAAPVPVRAAAVAAAAAAAAAVVVVVVAAVA